MGCGEDNSQGFSCHSELFYSIYLHMYICSITYVTGPAKRDQVGTKYTISLNGKYLEFCVQYLVSVSCTTLPIKLCFDGKIFTLIAVADH